MGLKLNSPLQLNGFALTHILVHSRDEFDGRDERLCDISVDPTHLVHNENPNLHQLVLRVDVSATEEDPAGAPYVIEVEGRALFQIDPAAEIDEAQKRRLVILNGSAILLGILRGYVSQATAASTHQVFLLPPINLVEAFKDKFESHTPPADAESEHESLAAENQETYGH